MLETFDVIAFLAALLGGSLLGGMYFGGLWWTVSRLPRLRHPYLFYFVSLVVRMIVLLVGLLWFITQLGLLESIGALAGLTVSRVLLIRICGPQESWSKPSSMGDDSRLNREDPTR